MTNSPQGPASSVDLRLRGVLSALEGVSLQLVEGQTFVDQDVYLDGHLFRNCTFTRCRLFLALGHFRLEGESLTMDGCQVMFYRPALHVLDFVKFVEEAQGHPL
jgi:hypothetical protein